MGLDRGIATLWLPLRSPRVAWGAALLGTALFSLGMARDLSFFDSGELALASVQLGLSHPPGQPLFTLLGFLFAKLSFGAPLWGLSFLSALSAGLTLLPALSLAERMHEAEGGRAAPTWLVPSVLLVGSQHFALWEQATRTEVYALAALLGLWSLARGAHLLDVGSQRRASWLGLGLGFGLCASVNPMLCLFALLAGAPGLAVALRVGKLGAAQPALVLAGGALGLLPYTYVPLVASRTDALVWGAPSSSAALFDYLSGRDFHVNLSVPAGVWLRQVAGWLSFCLDFELLPLWGIGLVAHALMPMRGLTRLCAPLSCLVAVAYLARYAHFVPEVPDYVSYASLASWLCLVGCAALVSALWVRPLRSAALALFGVVLASVLLGQPAPFARTRHRDRTARAIADALLASAPRGAVIVAASDHWVAPLWYLQEIEGARRDVVVLAGGLLSSSWYFEHVFRRHPDFVPAPLRGPGGQLGRLSRLLAQNPARAVLFEDPALAGALALPACVGPFFAMARVACGTGKELRAAALWERLRAEIDEGEPTSLGVLAAISYERGLLLAQAGAPQAALRTLLVPVALRGSDRELRSASGYVPLPRLPRWQRAVPLGDPARNLYVAAQLALGAGDSKLALRLMLAARERGLPEASTFLASVGPAP